MRKIAFIVACTIAAAPSFGADYATTQSICSGGSLITDDERGISIGNGTVLIQNMNCARSGSKKQLGNGWFTAAWECSVEGEPVENRVAFDLRIRDGYAEVRSNGQVTRYERCR